MVKRCLDTSSPFGIVLIREGSEVAPRNGEPQELSICGVGTFAEIREASKYVDGRWDLLTVGTGRFVVREVIADREPYLVGEVEELDDARGRRGGRPRSSSRASPAGSSTISGSSSRGTARTWSRSTSRSRSRSATDDADDDEETGGSDRPAEAVASTTGRPAAGRPSWPRRSASPTTRHSSRSC